MSTIRLSPNLALANCVCSLLFFSLSMNTVKARLDGIQQESERSHAQAQVKGVTWPLALRHARYHFTKLSIKRE